MTTDKLQVLFMGTPDFAVPTLERLHERHDVVAVVTQPDRPKGRGRALAPSAVKQAAERLGLSVIQPPRLRRRSVRMQLADLGADVFVVAAYGQILSSRLLAVPRLGCINVHASLLPQYRGAAPIQWAVLNGERESGVSIMQMDAGVDTGPVWLRRRVELAPGETAGSLHDKLAALGGSLLIEALELVSSGTASPVAQDDTRASSAPMLSKSDGRIDFAQSAAGVANWVCGMDPWPGAFAQWQGQAIRCFGATATDEHGEAGSVLTVDDRGLLVACASGAVWLAELQPPGRRRMSAKAFAAGNPVTVGTRLG